MSIIIFIIILAVLIFVHELGHFLIAKLFGIRVDEFALGFPPTLMSKKIGETNYKLNIIPFGGYVSIFGENPDDESLNGPEANSRSMARKPKLVQAAVLLAGVTFNIISAWLFISLSLGLGISPIANIASNPAFEKEGKIIVVGVAEGSPAEEAGIKAGDVVYEIKSVETKKTGMSPMTLNEDNLTVQTAQELIAEREKLTFQVYRVDEMKTFTVVPEEGIVAGKKAIGISMESTSLIQVPWYSALIEGAKTTYSVTVLTAQGLYGFVADAFTGKADYQQVSGPIGIVGLVDDASASGFSYLLFFTALISINLAVINVLPFPALDGGRILFIIIEAIMHRPIAPKVANALNLGGFALLILLMLVVTYQDILKLIIG